MFRPNSLLPLRRGGVCLSSLGRDRHNNETEGERWMEGERKRVREKSFSWEGCGNLIGFLIISLCGGREQCILIIQFKADLSGSIIHSCHPSPQSIPHPHTSKADSETLFRWSRLFCFQPFDPGREYLIKITTA